MLQLLEPLKKHTIDSQSDQLPAVCLSVSTQSLVSEHDGAVGWGRRVGQEGVVWIGIEFNPSWTQILWIYFSLFPHHVSLISFYNDVV